VYPYKEDTMIRYATEKDLEAILAIYNDAILNTTAVYTYKAKTLEERVSWFQTKQKEGYPLWVYEHDGKVVGYATSSPASTLPTPRVFICTKN